MKVISAWVLVIVMSALLCGCGDINLGWGNRNGDSNTTKTDSHDSTVSGSTNATSTNVTARLLFSGSSTVAPAGRTTMRGIKFLEGAE